MPRMGGAQIMGRDGELEILTTLARDAASGRGRLVLVADLAGGQPGPALRGLACGAAGNPLYIRELVGGLAQGTAGACWPHGFRRSRKCRCSC